MTLIDPKLISRILASSSNRNILRKTTRYFSRNFSSNNRKQSPHFGNTADINWEESFKNIFNNSQNPFSQNEENTGPFKPNRLITFDSEGKYHVYNSGNKLLILMALSVITCGFFGYFTYRLYSNKRYIFGTILLLMFISMTRKVKQSYDLFTNAIRNIWLLEGGKSIKIQNFFKKNCEINISQINPNEEMLANLIMGNLQMKMLVTDESAFMLLLNKAHGVNIIDEEVLDAIVNGRDIDCDDNSAYEGDVIDITPSK